LGMNKSISFIIIFVLVFPFLAQAEEISLSLDEAIALALRENRDILLKREDVKKAKEKIKEANAGLLPTLSFTGTWSDYRSYYDKDLAQSTTQTSLKQYLYKGGKTVNTIRYNKNKLEVYQALLDKTKIETILSVKDGFYTLLLAQGFANINQGIVENSKEHLNFIKQRYENGQASESDILNIEASLETVQKAYDESLNQIEAAQVILNNLLYLDNDTRIKPDGDFSYAPAEVAYDEAFLQAMRQRPEIKQYEAQAKADKNTIEMAKADSRPSIYASWDYYSRSHASLAGSRGWNDYNIIGLTFSWPIFDGWATKAKVEQAIIDLKETRLSKEKTIKDIALELKNTYLDLKNAIAKIKSTQAEADLYKDTLSVTEEKYKTGIASSLDLNDASLGYEVALFNQRQATYDYILAKARFEKATGGL